MVAIAGLSLSKIRSCLNSHTLCKRTPIMVRLQQRWKLLAQVRGFREEHAQRVTDGVGHRRGRSPTGSGLLFPREMGDLTPVRDPGTWIELMRNAVQPPFLATHAMAGSVNSTGGEADMAFLRQAL